MTGLAVVLAVAAATVTHGAEIGPAFNGDAVVRGERGAFEGDLSIVRRDGAGDRVLVTYPAPAEAGRRVGFQQVPAALAASDRWVGAALVDSADLPTEDFDVGVSQSSARPVGSLDGGPFQDLLPGCTGMAFSVLAADGDRLAVAQSNGTCDGREGTSVSLVHADGRRELVRALPRTGSVADVALSGRWLAWGESGRTRLWDLERGRTAFTLRGVERGFDVNGRGDLLAVTRRRGLVLRDGRTGRVRRIDRRATDERVALSEDRIAWAGRHRIRTATLTGRRLRAFERYDGYHRQVRGGLALRGRRLACVISDSNRGGGDFVPGGRGELHVVGTG